MRAGLQGVCGGLHLFEPYVFLVGRAKNDKQNKDKLREKKKILLSTTPFFFFF